MNQSGNGLLLLGAGLFLFVSIVLALAPAVATSGDWAIRGGVEFPSMLTTGETRAVSIAMKNNGTTSWNPYYSLVPTSVSYAWGVPGISAGGYYPPGAEKIFKFNIVAPSTVGVYNFQWQMKSASGALFQAPNPYLFASVCVTPRNGCADTDGSDTYARGTCAQANIGCFVDDCPGPDRTTVMEWECINNGCYNTIKTCPSGTACSFGKCVPSVTAVATSTPTSTPTRTPNPTPAPTMAAADPPTPTTTQVPTATPTLTPIPTLTPSPTTPATTPTLRECPSPTVNSCCTRTYSSPDCTPQDIPDNGRCASYEYCGTNCACLSNSCSSYTLPELCASNPACGWCGGDMKCKQRSEISCQPLGCNGLDLYCTSACGWSQCQNPTLRCFGGECDYSPEVTMTPTAIVTSSPISIQTPVPSTSTTTTATVITVTPTTIPTTQTPASTPTPAKTKPASATATSDNKGKEKSSGMDLTWSEWRIASTVAGNDVLMTRDLTVSGGTGKGIAEVRTAWETYAKPMEREGWTCSGIDQIDAWPKSAETSVEIPMAVNCTRHNIITAQQSNWTGDVWAANNSIVAQHVTSEVSGRNTDMNHRYQDVTVAVTCPPTFSCSGTTTAGNISAGGSYSLEVVASGNSITLTRTRGSYGGKNYDELEMKDSLGLEHRQVTGWIELDSSRITGTPSLQVMTAGEGPADTTPKSRCPQFDTFTVTGEAWKSCIGTARYEFVAPKIGTAPVVVRLVSSGQDAAGTASTSQQKPVESITVSYSKSEVSQVSAKTVQYEKQATEVQPTAPVTTMTTSAGTAIATTITTEAATPTAVLAPAASGENTYVKSIESISGISMSTDSSARASLEKETAKASSALDVKRIIEPSQETSAVKVVMENTGSETLKNVVVFEKIPKSVAASADEIKMWKVNGRPANPRIVESDPILALIFEAVPAGEVQTIEYEVHNEVQSSGAKDYSAPVVVSYALEAGVNGGDAGAFAFFNVFNKWIGGWLFWLIVTFFSVVVFGSYIVYKWIRSKTE